MFTYRMQLPDVSKEAVTHPSTLDAVGMEGVEIPITFDGERYGSVATILVNLEKEHIKGVHLSRLYLQANEFLSKNEVTFANLQNLLDQLIESQEGLSSKGSITLSFTLIQERQSLKTDNKGNRYYPVTFTVEKDEEYTYSTQVEVLYSSTCPCSTALSQHLVQDEFKKAFPGDLDKEEVADWIAKNHVATPHSQRSVAEVTVLGDIEVKHLIENVEEGLGTAVQTAVKREDEQEFARLNAQNLMFCEDAARTVKHVLEDMGIQAYYAKVSHLESLHAHDAVAFVSKGM